MRVADGHHAEIEPLLIAMIITSNIINTECLPSPVHEQVQINTHNTHSIYVSSWETYGHKQYHVLWHAMARKQNKQCKKMKSKLVGKYTNYFVIHSLHCLAINILRSRNTSNGIVIQALFHMA